MKALDYFRLKNKPYWKLEKDGKKIHEFGGDDVADAEAELQDYLSTLEPGRYTIKVKDTKSGDAGQGHLDFVIPTSRETTRQTPMQSQHQPVGPTLTEMLETARKQGERDASIEHRLQALEKGFETLKALTDELQKAVKELTDDDDTNDKPALEKIADIGKAMGGFGDMIKNLKSQ
ncbi:hypothetical protein [Fibrella aquatilis]|uniref:Uncharacterized protein n=1 Tax=Fibrella aquatilis TaxID=2817059 RepID=A0A939K2I1_9BACT|nr:hypothetical protein [Fibrella aquatilis]MBO0934598.1 hypothetical protein [Fibrella aquatilis]